MSFPATRMRRLRATESLLAAHEGESRLGAVYITGGGSELPLVARMLKELFGRVIKRYEVDAAAEPVAPPAVAAAT